MRLGLWTLTLAAATAACGQQAPSADTVEALAADPARLKELRARCKADHIGTGDALCSRVAEATRQRFMNGGKTPAADSASN